MSRKSSPGDEKIYVPETNPSPHSPGAQLALRMLVFWAGAVLMGLEIAGSRVLAPHFGNSVFIWGSLIAIFLMAISVGNYYGGRFADFNPSHSLLNSICIAVGIWIFALAVFSKQFCQTIAAAGFGEQTGPLVASMALFLAPSIGMGMVSPFAIRLAAHDVKHVGKTAGALYALSNIGSIAGTMVTTFVLIPYIGLPYILKGLAVVLILASVATLPGLLHKKQIPQLLMLAVITIGFLLCPESVEARLEIGEEVIYQASTPYHNIAVIDNTVEDVRQLRFDQYTESAVGKEPPHISWASYTDYFHLALLVQPQPERSLFIGAGGAVGPRAFHMHNPQMEIDIVDIDPKVLDIAKEYFYLEDDPHYRLTAKDGRMFVREAQQPYDAILLDAFTIGGRIPFHLVTEEFFTLCRERLNDDGVFVMNINSSLEGPNAGIFRSTYRTLKAVYPEVYVFFRHSERHARTDSNNVLFVATKSAEPIKLQEWRRRASAFKSGSYIQSRHLQVLVEDLTEDLPDVSAAPLFTDDYAPIETMPF